MKTENTQSRDRDATRGWSKVGLFAAALAFGTMGSCDRQVTPERVGIGASAVTPSATQEPCAYDEKGRAGQSDAELRADLERAQRIAALNREALDKLRHDQRWSDSSQHDGLESAMADTMGMIEQYDAEAECLSDALDGE